MSIFFRGLLFDMRILRLKLSKIEFIFFLNLV